MVMRDAVREWARRLLAGGAAFLAAYVAWRMSGLVSTVPVRLMQAIGAGPAQAAAFVLGASAAALLWLERTLISRERAPKLLLLTGLVCLSAGIIISGATRSERRVELTEGQTTEPLPAGPGGAGGALLPSPESLQFGLAHVRFIKLPGTGLTVDVAANVLLEGPGPFGGRVLTVRRMFPAMAGGTFLSAGRTGYSPRYRITTADGRVLDEAYVLMRLEPPGAEDFFRVREMPHTFYVRYYPDGAKSNSGAGGRQSDGHVFLFRAARNLDLVVETTRLRISEQAPIESLRMSFEDVRPWVEISIVRDPGLYLLLPGALLVIAAIIAGAVRADSRSAR